MNDDKCRNEGCGSWGDSPENNNCYLEWHRASKDVDLTECKNFDTTRTVSIPADELEELDCLINGLKIQRHELQAQVAELEARNKRLVDMLENGCLSCGRHYSKEQIDYELAEVK